MQSSEDRPTEAFGAGASDATLWREAVRQTSRFTGSARTAPRGSSSSIGDDETHHRLQAARNQARHSTEDMIRRELGPEWV